MREYRQKKTIYYGLNYQKSRIIYGDERIVTIYGQKNSLSKNLATNILNAFKVYKKYEKQNLIKLLYSILRLSYMRLIKYKKITKLSK